MKRMLIIGEYNDFAIELIEKFYREEWTVYLLTKNKKTVKFKHVFKYYIFEYDNINIKEVISSAKPELVIFMGAHDKSLDWEENPNKAANNYVSGLNNILTHVGLIGVSKFIYLSSEKVFEDEYLIDITEEDKPHPKSIHNMALLQGENMVNNLKAITGAETIIVRIAGLYWIPSKASKNNCIFFDMSRKALENKRIEINNKRVFSALFIKDAIEALYSLIEAPIREYDLYHISSTQEIRELELALIIKEACPYPIQIVDETVGQTQRLILSNKRFSNEFSLEIKNSYKTILPKIVSFVNKNKDSFLENNPHEINLKKTIKKIIQILVPFIEAILVFVLVFYLSMKKTEYPFLEGLNLYILYTLFFAILYGRKQAIVTSFLAAIGQIYYHFFMLEGLSVDLKSHLYISLVQMFLISLPVGHLRDVYREIKIDKDKEIEALEDKLKDLSIINNINTDIKNYYADKIIGSKESVGKIYNITSKLQNAILGEVQFAAIEVLMEIFNTDNVSIYFRSNKEYYRLASSSSDLASSFGKTIRASHHKEIFNALDSKKIYINKTFKSDEPSMVSALSDENDNNNIRVIILVWSLPYEKMNLDSANLLSITASLFYSYFVKEADTLNALAYQRYIAGTKILKREAFVEMVDLYKRVERKGYGKYTLLYVKNQNIDIKQLYGSLRNTDFIGQTDDKNFVILLTNTSENERLYVEKRLEDKGFKLIT